MPEPLVSIIIPTFNRAHLISETLDSILEQTYQNWECIVVDDGSSDNTAEVMAEYIEKNSRFKYYHRPQNRLAGGNAARNFGFEMSSGEYVNWFDSDDVMSVDKIEIDLERLITADASFTISLSDFFSEFGRPKKKLWNENLWSDDPINDFITYKIGWGMNTPLWKKSDLLNNKIQFDEQLQSSQDYFFHIQALAKGLKPVIIKRVLVHVRKHENKIEHNILKSPSKAKINLYLFENAAALNLNADTISHMRNRSNRILVSLYRIKNWKTATSLSINLLFLSEVKNKKHILELFLYGTFFRLFSRGYKFLQ